mmetsp:Transcript_34848/g.43007  ORF Transcript_34848/g.43007 Transcript_34848/m.43007 type:complete len:545 (-) Transcript_34848:1215-2849(-)
MNINNHGLVALFILACGGLLVLEDLAIRLYYPAEDYHHHFGHNDVYHPQHQRHHEKESQSSGGFHIVFSSSCNLFQDWQSKLLQWTAREIAGQRGKITRIVSGCDGFDEKEAKKRQKLSTHPGGIGNDLVNHKTLYSFPVEEGDDDGFLIHFTPTFPHTKEFPWMNKPMGIQHWLDNTDSNLEDSIIVILDPDFIMLDPIVEPDQPIRSFKNDELLCTTTCKNRHLKTKQEKEDFRKYLSTITDVVKEGRPIAQGYGLGSVWMTRMDIENITGKGSRASGIDLVDVRHHYSIGPPYFMHVNDLRKLMPLWVKYMKPCHDADPFDIQADMYAFVLAAIELNLPHRVFDNYMVSSVKSVAEGWKWADEYIISPDWTEKESEKDKKNLNGWNWNWNGPSCSQALDWKDYVHGRHRRVVSFIHMAQYYGFTANHKKSSPSSVGDQKGLSWFFHKGHVPPNIFSCDLPLLIQPPEELIQVQNVTRNRRAAWVICSAITGINRAVLAWKRMHCNAPYNVEQRLRLDNLKSCPSDTAGKTCFPGARIVVET